MTAATPSGRALPAPAEHDHEAEGLIEARRERASTRLASIDSRTTALTAGGFLGAAVALAFALPTERSASLALLALAVGAYALTSRVEFEVGIGSAIPTQLVFVPMLFFLPAGLVPLCVAAGLLLGNAVDYAKGRLHAERALLQLVSACHALGPALVIGLAGEPSAAWRNWPIFLAALAAQFTVDFAVSAARARLVFSVSAASQLRMMAPVYLVDAALAPVGLLVARAASGDPYSLLLVMPLVGLLSFFARERRRRIDHALELGHAYRGTAFLLGDVIEADDAYTGTHSRDVVDLVLDVSSRLGLDSRERRNAELTALLHDVGKIRIPAEIINKAGPLTDEEFAVVKTHTVEGERMLEKVGGLLGEVGRLVRSCHERWDGAGYPDGLAGEEIPLVARIVCCCDAFSAMTTDRPYRKARPPHEALAELERCAGTQFDPRVVAALVAVSRPPARA
jgi:HD-GYP domain-containing protein (c-di-GMP phosphodiesterase class II)